MELLDRIIIRLNNRRRRLFRPRVPGEATLLLFSTCLQRHDCARNLRADLQQCARCGRCPVGELLELAARYHVRPAMAAGGKLALAEARRPEIKLVVAVACTKELREGILAAWPKKVWVVTLDSSGHPCRDSLVSIPKVEASLQLWST